VSRIEKVNVVAFGAGETVSEPFASIKPAAVSPAILPLIV
jgi:hypothetical protein